MDCNAISKSNLRQRKCESHAKPPRKVNSDKEGNIARWRWSNIELLLLKPFDSHLENGYVTDENYILLWNSRNDGLRWLPFHSLVTSWNHTMPDEINYGTASNDFFHDICDSLDLKVPKDKKIIGVLESCCDLCNELRRHVEILKKFLHT